MYTTMYDNIMALHGVMCCARASAASGEYDDNMCHD